MDYLENARRIFKPILTPECYQWLEGHGMEIFINALTGVR